MSLAWLFREVFGAVKEPVVSPTPLLLLPLSWNNK